MRIIKVAGLPAPDKAHVAFVADGFTYTFLRSVMARAEDGSAKPADYPDFVSTTRYTTLAAQGDYGDGALYLRGFTPEGQLIRQFAADPHRLVNVHALTKPTRTRLGDFLAHAAKGTALMLGLVIPYADQGPDGWAMILPGGPVELDGHEGELEQAASLADALEETLPRMKFLPDTLGRDGSYVTVQVAPLDAHHNEVIDTAAEVYFEATAGIVVTPRVQCMEGRASVLVDTARLPAGTKVRVKAGLKHYAGMADFTFEV